MDSYDVPPPDEVSAPWWEATRSGQLLVQRCGVCGHHQHPPRALCIGCGGMDGLAWIAASGTGVIDTYTVVHRAPRPGVATPYTLGRVRLAEGVLLLTWLEGREAGTWHIGEPVQVSWSPLPDGRALPVFRPVDAVAGPMPRED